MDEPEIRKQAISRYENGESPKAIYQSLGKSKRWFFKWLKRYEYGGSNWSDDLSKRPHHTRDKISETMEQTIIDTRKKLETTLYAQIGALNIKWHLEEQGLTPPPVSTINSVLKRNNLVKKKTKYEPKGADYPALKAEYSNFMHQFDVVGPRYLKTDGRFYSANAIDTYDRRCCINPARRQTKADILASLLRCFIILGIPKYLQMDNKLSMRGSNRYPHSFGLIIRLCLYLGIQPIFIPIKEPWRNGIIEKFQDVFDKSFFRSQYFKSFYQVLSQARGFEIFHDNNHRYSTLDGKTPAEKMNGDLKYLPNDFMLPSKLGISSGYVHLVRFIRSNRILDIFGEKFAMPVELEHEYVWITIDTEKETLSIYHDFILIDKLDYPLPKTYIELSKIDL
jgi:transposase